MRRLSLFLGCLIVVYTGAAAAQEYPARVVTYAEHQGGNVLYRYELRNTGPTEVRRFYVGCDCRSPTSAIPQLQVLPDGAQVSRLDDFGTWYELPSTVTQQPPGWRVRALRPRGAVGYWIEWYMPSARANAGAPSGQTLGGFTVVLPGADEAYLTGHFTAQPEGGRASTSGYLALLDTTPPTLSLETQTAAVEPGITAAVRVVANAKDDRDPEPKVIVESVGRADDAGSDYIMVYSATDASGNRATASARVRLPTAPGTSAPATPSLPGGRTP